MEYKEVKIGLLSTEKLLDETKDREVKALRGLTIEFKPEMDGIFCQKIFGSEHSGTCECGTFHKNFKIMKTPCKCWMIPTDSWERRTRLGHIKLATPVVHYWFKPYIFSPSGTYHPITLDKVLE